MPLPYRYLRIYLPDVSLINHCLECNAAKVKLRNDIDCVAILADFLSLCQGESCGMPGEFSPPNFALSLLSVKHIFGILLVRKDANLPDSVMDSFAVDTAEILIPDSFGIFYRREAEGPRLAGSIAEAFHSVGHFVRCCQKYIVRRHSDAVLEPQRFEVPAQQSSLRTVDKTALAETEEIRAQRLQNFVQAVQIHFFPLALPNGVTKYSSSSRAAFRSIFSLQSPSVTASLRSFSF